MSDEAKKLVELMFEHIGQFEVERFEASWFYALRPERRERLRLVIALAVELEHVRAVTPHATALGEGAIESVIDGDWRGVGTAIELLSFAVGPASREVYGETWAPFVKLLRDELRRRTTH